MAKIINFRGWLRPDGIWYARTKDNEIEIVAKTKEQLINYCCLAARMGQLHFVRVVVDIVERNQ